MCGIELPGFILKWDPIRDYWFTKDDDGRVLDSHFHLPSLFWMAKKVEGINFHLHSFSIKGDYWMAIFFIFTFVSSILGTLRKTNTYNEFHTNKQASRTCLAQLWYELKWNVWFPGIHRLMDWNNSLVKRPFQSWKQSFSIEMDRTKGIEKCSAQ